ncbi:MAG: FkbM family methyltransferase [Dysgonamonadaceae bacterium]|jgi:FkbM family methyltransferase|nr:FkbM family methyltransferase [Dysgonamonadaceae bacterium]
MIKALRTFLLGCKNLGIIKTIEVFIRFKIGCLNNIKLHGIEHIFSMRAKTSDFFTFIQIFIKEEYNIDFDSHSRFVIDAGANIGLFAIYIKNKYPETIIICIEPDPENFELLQRNVTPYKDIYCENCGLWNKDTKLKVYDKYNKGKWAMVVEEDVINGNVSAISMNSLLNKYDMNVVDILKIDIETSEKQLFFDNFEWLPKMNTIVIELHDSIEFNCAKTFFQAINSQISAYEFSMQGENVVIKNIHT